MSRIIPYATNAEIIAAARRERVADIAFSAVLWLWLSLAILAFVVALASIQPLPAAV